MSYDFAGGLHRVTLHRTWVRSMVDLGVYCGLTPPMAFERRVSDEL
jgi:hypothetical protein